MKKLQIILVLCTFLFSSCTILVPAMIWGTQEKITHEYIMDSYKTKKDVIKNFGVPTSKVKELKKILLAN